MNAMPAHTTRVTLRAAAAVDVTRAAFSYAGMMAAAAGATPDAACLCLIYFYATRCFFCCHVLMPRLPPADSATRLIMPCSRPPSPPKAPPPPVFAPRCQHADSYDAALSDATMIFLHAHVTLAFVYIAAPSPRDAAVVCRCHCHAPCCYMRTPAIIK